MTGEPGKGEKAGPNKSPQGPRSFYPSYAKESRVAANSETVKAKKAVLRAARVKNEHKRELNAYIVYAVIPFVILIGLVARPHIVSDAYRRLSAIFASP